MSALYLHEGLRRCGRVVAVFGMVSSLLLSIFPAFPPSQSLNGQPAPA
jgi:hypothetical protein